VVAEKQVFLLAFFGRVPPRASGHRHPRSPILQPRFPSSLFWTACCSPLPPPPLLLPLPLLLLLLGPLIKAGLSATAAHQGAPHPHLQQHGPLGIPLRCTHTWVQTHTGAKSRNTHRPPPPYPPLPPQVPDNYY